MQRSRDGVFHEGLMVRSRYQMIVSALFRPSKFYGKGPQAFEWAGRQRSGMIKNAVNGSAPKNVLNSQAQTLAFKSENGPFCLKVAPMFGLLLGRKAQFRSLILRLLSRKRAQCANTCKAVCSLACHTLCPSRVVPLIGATPLSWVRRTLRARHNRNFRL